MRKRTKLVSKDYLVISNGNNSFSAVCSCTYVPIAAERNSVPIKPWFCPGCQGLHWPKITNRVTSPCLSISVQRLVRHQGGLWWVKFRSELEVLLQSSIPTFTQCSTDLLWILRLQIFNVRVPGSNGSWSQALAQEKQVPVPLRAIGEQRGLSQQLLIHKLSVTNRKGILYTSLNLIKSSQDCHTDVVSIVAET